MEGWAESDGVQWRGSEKTVASVKIWPQGDPLGGFLGLLGLVVPGGQVQGELRGQETARALPQVLSQCSQALGPGPGHPSHPDQAGTWPTSVLIQGPVLSSPSLPHPQLTGQMRGQEGQEHWTGNQTWSTTQKPWVGFAPSLHVAPEPLQVPRGSLPLNPSRTLPKHSGGHLLQEAVADERGGAGGSSVLESCVCQALELGGGDVWCALLAASFSQVGRPHAPIF